MNDVRSKPSLDRPAIYQIGVPGLLNERWSEWFEGMTIRAESGADGPPITTLTGIVADQAALHGILRKLYNLGLPLLSVSRIEFDPEGEDER